MSKENLLKQLEVGNDSEQVKKELQAISDREMYIEMGTGGTMQQLLMDELEYRLFGFVSPRLMTDGELDRWLKKQE